MKIYYKELPLEEGFEISAKPSKYDRLVGGREVSIASGIGLFESCTGKIKCWRCSCEADRWIVDKDQNDLRSKPVLNLYATKAGVLVLMTRDHIIPKSLGGVDTVENLRPGCEDCNGNRGSKMNKADKKFMQLHPHLVDAERAARGQERLARNYEKALKHSKEIQNEVLHS